MKKNNIQRDIQKVFQYFAHFSYAPTFEEIHTFLEKKVTPQVLVKELEKLVKKGIIVKKILQKREIYTLGEYTTGFWESQKFKVQSSKFKVQKVLPYVRFLSCFPQIKLIGLSGSVAMMNADGADDIDLFIITSKNRLWTGRFIAAMTAQIAGMRRKRGKRKEERVKNKLCLNLFFDEKHLRVPSHKKNEYVAHEILQMKPLFVRNSAYNRFLEVNSWVFALFPNAKKGSSNVKAQMSNQSVTGGQNPKSQNNSLTRELVNSLIGNGIERLLKNLQLKLISHHKTSEIITDTQLWFFPDDFEKKIESLSQQTSLDKG